MIEKTEKIIMLKDFYGPLLTQKQQEALNLYYEDDWSLSEIADSMAISRQGVYDLLKRAEQALADYEQRLCLLERFSLTREHLEKVFVLLSEKSVDQQKIEGALEILRAIDDLI
ncbi:signal recognition particle associated protein [hydrocarbon metagenome]|uniref:Signal recognition particle associated protein n=1 Tax=hydrocarbon metagenome TaxID=938273 RepID=A0A0W8E7P6_9ZZZZ